ncbi:MAG: DUF397 domain-containing protein [Actinomadura sp.]
MTGPDLAHATWRKSSYSGSGEGACVEVARIDRVVAVRDSKNQDGPVLTFTPATWHSFLIEIRTGRFGRSIH